MNRRANTIRRVTIDAADAVALVDGEEPVFYADITLPRSGKTGDQDPRSTPPTTLRWRTGPLGPAGGPLSVGSRVRTIDNVYEVLTGPTDVYATNRVIAQEVEVLPVSSLYPEEATITDQAGDVLAVEAICAVWSPNEDHTERGDYEDFNAAAPLDHRNLLVRNNQLRMGGDIFRILTSTVEAGNARVSFSVRRAGG